MCILLSSYNSSLKVQHINLNKLNLCHSYSVLCHSYSVLECFIHFIFLLDDYAKARKKLARAEMTSNLESEMEAATERPERKKRYANFCLCVLYSELLRLKLKFRTSLSFFARPTV